MNRLALASAFALAATLAASAQTNTFPISGNVGIGTTTPASQLDIHENGQHLTFLINKKLTGSWPASADPTTMTIQSSGWSAGNLAFATGNTEWMRITQAGNVGIGTTDPQGYRLRVFNESGWGLSSRAAYSNIAGERRNYVLNAGSGDWWAMGIQNSGAFALDFLDPNGGGASKANSLTVTPNGHVGIGTSHPSNHQMWNRVLDVNGPDHSKLLATENTGGVKTGIFSHCSWWSGGVGKIGTESIHPLALMAGYGNDVMTLLTNGNVGIGTTSPTHKLAVNGTIKAKEIIVETTGWSDYVFADDYALQPLAEVEAHIKTNKHLPGIPSAAQVAAEGVSLGELQAKLLAKIEELTLHQIAQQKLLNRQESLLETQAATLTSQSQELASLRSEVRTLRDTAKP